MKLNIVLLTASLGLAATPGAWAQGVLSDNLANASAGRSMVLDTSWAAAKFTTDGQAYNFRSAVLLMSGIQGSGSSAQVDIYSDTGANKPGAAIATLVAPGSYPPSLTPTTYTSPGVPLAANSSFWVVLKAPTGGLTWSYTENPSGTGPGFAPDWSQSLDAGSTWSTSLFPPYQMQVNVEVVPEPCSWAILVLGLAGYAVRRPQAKARVA
jgi:hypothetical protein